MQKAKSTGSSQILHRPLLAAVAVSAVILLLAVTFTNPIIAWFKSKLTVTNNAQISNFIVNAQYSFDGSTWTTYTAGTPIPVTLANVNNLKVQVQYRGVAAHYVRVSFFGGFYNKNTKTYLPMKGDSQSSLFTATGTNWIKSGDYIYYKSVLSKQTSLTALSSNVLSVTADTTSWANKSNYQDYAGEVYILLDAVQCNRIEAHWEIDTIPTA